MTTRKQSPPILKQHGVVVIIDALGVSNLNTQESIRFLRARDRALRTSLQWSKEERAHIRENLSITGEEQFEAQVSAHLDPTPHTISVNDTLIFRWPIPDVDDSTLEAALLIETLRYCSIVLSVFLTSSLCSSGLKYRGALALGKFITRAPDAVIGEAVAQAAAIYDRHDHIGVVVEPNTSAYLEQLCESDPSIRHVLTEDMNDLGNTSFFKSLIGFKDHSPLLLWTIPWTGVFKQFLESEHEPEDPDFAPREALIAFVWDRLVPLEAQDKCFKLLSYYDNYCEFLKTLPEPTEGGETAGDQTSGG